MQPFPKESSMIPRHVERDRYENIHDEELEVGDSEPEMKPPRVVRSSVVDEQRVVKARQRALEISKSKPWKQQVETIDTSATIEDVSFFSDLKNRVLDYLKIPRSISKEVERAEKTGAFKPVDKFNADPKQMPSIMRRQAGPLRKFILGTALAVLSTTHEPQIEQVADSGIEVARSVEKKVRKAYKNFIASAEDYISRNRPILKEAHAKGGGSDTKSGETKSIDVSGRTKKQQESFAKFTETIPGISKENQKSALDLIETVEGGNINYENFFLTMEKIHGQITNEEANEATDKLFELRKKVTASLSQEELKSPLRVAFELAKQRTTYVRDEAGLYSMIMNGEGNCESLVRLLISEVPKTGTSSTKSEMAVQVFKDHVRFLIKEKENSSEPWHWIDGHEHGILTPEEMRGALIVFPDEVAKQALKLNTVQQKVDDGADVPETALGYKTNSMIKWETADHRLPSKKSFDGPIPERVDEKKQINNPFHKAEKLKIDEHTRFVEVSPEFFTGPSTLENKTVESVRIAPSESRLAEYLSTGYVAGPFNDLSPLKGISVEIVKLHNPKYGDENAAMDIDLSPLQGSPIKILEINTLLKTKGWENLDFKNLKTIDVGYSEINHVKDALEISKKLENLTIDFDENSGLSVDSIVEMIQNYPDKWTSTETKDFISSAKNKNVKNLRFEVHSPFESIVRVWNYNYNSEKWLVSEASSVFGNNDYLSIELRSSIENWKQNKKELHHSSDIGSFDYLFFDGQIDFQKVKTLVIDHPNYEESVSGENTEKTDVLEMNFEQMKVAKNLETIVLEMGSYSDKNLDVSALKVLPIKELVIRTSESEPNINVEGLKEGVKVRIEIVTQNEKS